jgi:hypothetical protein
LVLIERQFPLRVTVLSKRPTKKSKRGAKPKAAGRSADAVGLRRSPDGTTWELVHPRCALERREDIEEVESMIAMGETEIAVEELRWLLGGCHELIEGHCLLGDLALAAGDAPLARGHYGIGYQLGLAAWQRAGSPIPLPFRLPPNQHFHRCGQGLVRCLKQLDKQPLAQEVADVLLRCDPADPLSVRGILSGLSIIEP